MKKRQAIFKKLAEEIIIRFPKYNIKYYDSNNFSLVSIGTEGIFNLLEHCKNHPKIYCEQLIDLCGVDYLYYGKAEWDSKNANKYGFSRASNKEEYQKLTNLTTPSRFAVVYNLLSYSNNFRVRIKCFLDDHYLSIPSCTDLWPAANWYEREVFDLFGINFINHPNLTRILMEENFDGFPLRKDFPLNGNLEVRFDAKSQAVQYEAIDIEPYSVVPKVIR